MEEELTPGISLGSHELGVSIENHESTMSVPASVVLNSSTVATEVDCVDDIRDNLSLADGSSFDGSSVSSSALTSSLSSFEFSDQQGATTGPEHDRTAGQADPEIDQSSNHDKLTELKGDLIEHQGLAISHALAERVSCIDSIKWLGHHLPESVVAFLIDEIEVEEAGRGPLSDSETHGFASSAEHLDFETSQVMAMNGRFPNDDDQSLSHLDLASQQPSNLGLKHQNDYSGYTAQNPEHGSFSGLRRKIESKKVGNYLSESISGHRRKARSVQNDYEQHQSAHSDLGNALYDDSFVRDESAGYQADYHESVGNFGSHDLYGSCNFSESSRKHDYVVGYNDSKAGWDDENCSEEHVNNSLNGPLDYDERNGGQVQRPRRRHSIIGLNTSLTTPDTKCAVAETFEEHRPHRRVERRSSLPLVVRSMDFSDRHAGRGSMRQSNNQASDSSSCGTSSLRFQRQPHQRKNSQRIKRRGSARSAGSISSLLLESRIGIEGLAALSASHSEGGRAFIDPFPYASDDDKRDEVRKDRVMKTRDSIIKLSGDFKLGEIQNQLDALESDDEGDTENMYFTDAIPPATRHDCALLFVDISGFTKLSTTLEVEPLSKTINNYFQMIVDEVEAFGGDILKFAGDAVFCEWQATTSNPLDPGDGISLSGSSQGSIEPWHGLGLEECVLTAAACGARIVDKCSDYPVYDGIGSPGTQVATLNVHCGLGFGEVVGVHVGDRESRMEYLILGDPIEQVADAILCASRGEVVASPDALVVLEETAELDEIITNADMNKPQVIATKSTSFFKPKGNYQVQTGWSVALQNLSTKPRERLARRCNDWTMPALTRLRQRMALYVHPVVVNDESAAKVYPGDRNRAQERHRSEAELRDVYTVFIMPLITARLTGDDEEDCKVLVLLNDIMLIMTRELSRFKGHLRQFIVDDKGVVLIANFGLRGSTFPNMVTERAIPFTTTVQTLLKTELNTECQIGATFDKAYCGVVGGVSRHEYAVLGPSVNLAARLMGNPNNTGFLVDESVKEKAGSRQFRALPPVKAKGYKHLVPIFEPIQTPDPMWNDNAGHFVGREQELNQIAAMADEVVDKGGPARFFLVRGEPGAGKSAFCRQASKQMKTRCIRNDIPHLNIGVVCNEGDVFVPFSITRMLFLEILNYLHEIEHPDQPPRDPNEVVDTDEIVALLQGTLAPEDASESLRHWIQICEMVEIPDQFIDTLGKLVLTRNRADVVEGPNNVLMLNTIANYIVKVFLNCTVCFDLVVLVLDEVANMDEMSWKIVELLYNHSQNMLVLGTTRVVEQDELKASEEFWVTLRGEGLKLRRFKEIKLETMKQSDIEQLVAIRIGHGENEMGPATLQDDFNRSGGIPNIASELLAQLYKDGDQLETSDLTGGDSTRTAGVVDVRNIGEIVLHRMDALPSNVRTHLNLGAILGSAFELMDVVTVFEQYRGVEKDDRVKHAKSVHESLDEAVKKGILEVANRETATHARYNASDHPYASNNATYKFTHDVWRSNILRLTLDEWKKDMHSLIAQSMETVMDSQLANDYRVLTRLFSHWKESGSAKKAATLALKMGRSLEDIGLTHQSLIVYRESLDMWKAMDNSNEVPDETIGGLSVNLLEKLESSDVEHLIKLNVALGRCYTNILDPKESIKCFQTALNFIYKAPSSVLLEDRSIIFPVFSGLFIALRFGHNEDFNYEEGLVSMFLRETKLYNDPIHYSRALAMRAEMLARHGEIAEALQSAHVLRELYIVEDHTGPISKAYGSDRSGQCIAQSACWDEYLGNHERALQTCEYVIQELLPKMDQQNVCNSFQMLYPVIWVMKNNGKALDARTAFAEFVVHSFATRLDDRGLTSDRPLHNPIMALLDMVATDCKTERLKEYAEWAMVEQNGLFGSELNFVMGSAGRTADSITAEICLLLARHTSDNTERSFFTCKGYEVARDVMELTREKDDSNGMELAHKQVQPIYLELKDMHSRLPIERRSRRPSCRW